MDNGLQALLNIHSACRLIDKDFIRTSHDSPDRADEGEDLGFDPGVIPEPRDALLHPEADCTRGGGGGAEEGGKYGGGRKKTGDG